MNAGSVSVQLFSSVGGLAIAFFMFQTWQKSKDKYTPNRGDNGLDPNFPGGKPIQPGQRIDPNDFKVPSCQVWNVQQNLFENAGHPEWDSDVTGQTCFSGASVNGSIVRYVGPDNKISYNVENPLNTTQDEKGTCYFWDGANTYTFPDYGGYTPPNRSARLCFDSGESQSDAGFFFERKKDSERFWNPNVTWYPFVYQAFGGVQVYGDNQSYSDPQQDQCQVYRKFQSQDLAMTNSPMSAYTTTTESLALGTDMAACLKLDNSRYWQKSQKRIVYKDPASQTLVETQMLPF